MLSKNNTIIWKWLLNKLIYIKMLKICLPITIVIIINPQWHILCSILSLLTIFIIKILFFPLLCSKILSSIIFIDVIRILLILLSIWVSIIIFLARFSNYYFLKNNNIFRFFILSLLIILILSFSVNNIIIFYILFEISLIPTILIIMGWGYQPERINAGYYLIIYTVSASLPLLLFITSLYIKNYSLCFIIFIYSPPLFYFSSSLILSLAFLVKIPIYLTHLWLPKAHVEAPAAGSIILAGILLKLGAYGIIRLLIIIPEIINPLYYLLIIISLWGILTASSICVRQHDIKSLIAYSSVRHIGLIIIGITRSFKWGWDGAIIIIIAHGLSRSGLFFLANASYENTNTRRIFLTKGIISLSPIISLWWFLLSIANIGAPPTLNILREIIILSRILSSSLWRSIFILPSLFLAIAYSFILFTSISHGPLSNFSIATHLSFTRNSITSITHIFPLFIIFINSSIFSYFLI